MAEQYDIDKIMHKDPTERTADEIEYMIEWHVQARMQEEEFKAAENARIASYERICAMEEERIAEMIDIQKETAAFVLQKAESM